MSEKSELSPQRGRATNRPARTLKLQKVPLSTIDRNSPFRHPTSPPQMMQEIARLHGIFQDVSGGTLGRWVDDFRREMWPDRELEVWQDARRALRGCPRSSQVGPAERRELVGLLLAATMSHDPFENAELRLLTREGAVDIRAGRYVVKGEA